MSKVLKVKVTPPWISVNERLPKDYEHVLAYYPDCKSPNKIIITYCNSGKFTLDDADEEDSYFGNASHWMPLPKPPEV